jgi:hypothetical protein
MKSVNYNDINNLPVKDSIKTLESFNINIFNKNENI